MSGHFCDKTVKAKVGSTSIEGDTLVLGVNLT